MSFTNAAQTIVISMTSEAAFISTLQNHRPVEITVAQAREIIAKRNLVQS